MSHGNDSFPHMKIVRSTITALIKQKVDLSEIDLARTTSEAVYVLAKIEYQVGGKKLSLLRETVSYRQWIEL